jgi:phosphoribosylformimino-5-aminoimidazole carboxamide ribotide isomerase
MLILPAIDLQGGEAVRLYKGDYAQKTVYNKDPVSVAKEFEWLGVKYLHIVDLDGAKEGATVNRDTIAQIRESTTIPIQVGGGIRSAFMVEYYLYKMKIDRVILGTTAIQDPWFLKDMINKHGSERIVVGVDVRDGKVAASGWLETSGINYMDFIEGIKKMGVEYAVVTDISKDGTLTSPNWDLYKPIKGINVIVAGGVSCDEDVLYATDKYYGIIIGKAFYEGKVDLKKCLKDVLLPR